MDFFTVPTIRFQILYVFVVFQPARRQVVHVAEMAQPAMAWVIQPLRAAMPFGIQSTSLFRDNDAIYGDEVDRFLKRTGIEELRAALRSPWQNPFVERHGGILRREVLESVVLRFFE
jgi:putative transposase